MNKINCLIEKINFIIENLYNNEINIYLEIKEIITSINDVYVDFVSIIPKLNNIGVNIDSNGVINQLKKMMDGIEKKDKVLIYDSLNYEIKDTIQYYSEILEIMNEGKADDFV